MERIIGLRTYSVCFVATILFVLLGGMRLAYGQTMEQELINSYSIRVNTPLTEKTVTRTGPIVPPFPNPEVLLPDFYGWNHWLRDQGVAFMADNTNEYAGAITSPTPGFVNYRQGSSNAGQYSLRLDMDWSKLAGIPGLATHVITVGRYGTTANRMFGDWLNHSSEDYGGGGNVVVHLVMAYAEETLLGGRVSLAAGRMAQMSDFAASNLFCNFMNNSMCGRPKAATDSAYYAGYPASVWAFRARGRPMEEMYLQAGIYFAEEGIYQVYQHRTGFKWNGSNIVGQIFPVEAGWEPRFGKKGDLPGHYKLGFSYENVRRPDSLYDVNDGLYPLTGLAQKQRAGSYSTWLMTDQKILTYPGGKKDSGVTMLLGAIYNALHTALRDYEVYGAIINRGFWDERPYDTIGLAFTYTHITPSVQRAETLLRSLGKNLPNHATGIQRHTKVLELNYACHILPGVNIQPVFLYYFRPNGQGNLKDAAMLGVRTHINFF